MSRTNIPVDDGVSYKMEMTPEQYKHLKSLIIGLMVDAVKTISKEQK